jgi:hypothetical protein
VISKFFRFIRKARKIGFLLAFAKLICVALERPNLAGPLYTNFRLFIRPLKLKTRKSWRQYFRNQKLETIEIDKAGGYVPVTPKELPSLSRVVEVCNDILDRKGRDNLETWYSNKSTEASKDFFYNVLTEEDILDNPELMRFVLSDEVVSAVTEYIGFLPRLCTVGIYYSKGAGEPRGSQNWHLDGTDPHHVKCFINLNDVGPKNGPFTFIPADKTDSLRLKNGGLSKASGAEDAEALEKCYIEHGIQLIGPAGTGGFSDASRCLHFGSRCEEGFRICLMFHYSVFADYTKTPKNPVRDIRIMHYPEIQSRFAYDNLRAQLLSVN